MTNLAWSGTLRPGTREGRKGRTRGNSASIKGGQDPAAAVRRVSPPDYLLCRLLVPSQSHNSNSNSCKRCRLIVIRRHISDCFENPWRLPHPSPTLSRTASFVRICIYNVLAFSRSCGSVSRRSCIHPSLTAFAKDVCVYIPETKPRNMCLKPLSRSLFQMRACWRVTWQEYYGNRSTQIFHCQTCFITHAENYDIRDSNQNLDG